MNLLIYKRQMVLKLTGCCTSFCHYAKVTVPILFFYRSFFFPSHRHFCFCATPFLSGANAEQNTVIQLKMSEGIRLGGNEKLGLENRASMVTSNIPHVSVKYSLHYGFLTFTFAYKLFRACQICVRKQGWKPSRYEQMFLSSSFNVGVISDIHTPNICLKHTPMATCLSFWLKPFRGLPHNVVHHDL